MPDKRVLLVGYEDRDNLGLRYLKSSASRAGHTVTIMTYQSDPGPLLEAVRRENPDVIGFSLIFQYMAPDFARVVGALRDNNVTAHITTGGHYPSFDYEEVLRRMPGLDSVVRFEGEATLVELLDTLESGADWRGLKGIAYRNGDEIVANPLRPPIADLDTLPFPDRAGLNYESEALPTAAILASRGCPWNCSFCSIRPFYEAQGGLLRRLRHPESVLEEMVGLYRDRNVRAFLFQDDDFLAGGRKAKDWAVQIADGLRQSGLTGKVSFKVSCRSDEIEEECLRKLAAGGLCHVYMGVESGDEQGLINMNKHLKPAQHIRAGQILKSLGLSFDFGFMLLDPFSTFDSVRNNINFLEAFVGDGWTVACFCRMLPYAGTPLKTKLEQEGRLLGTPFEPDYRFVDPRLDIFYDWMLETFYERNFTNTGLCNILRALLFEAHLNMEGIKGFDSGKRAYLHHLTAVCNGIACYTLKTAVDYFESRTVDEIERDKSFLKGLTYIEKEQEQKLLAEIAQLYGNVHREHQEDELSCTRPAGYELLGGFENSWTLAPV
jgi:anaerobic magnesium-protoporphyrin IX monomethyl ester cyclase